MSLQDLKNDININSLKGKNERFGIAPSMLDVKINNYSDININKILRHAKDRGEFDNLIVYELFRNKDKSNFYDFSLLMGLNFGYYNSYGFLELSSDLKERVLRSNPNFMDTKYILENFKNDLDILFKNKYNISSEELNTILDKMLSISNEEDLFNSSVVKDIGKTIMGIKMKYSSYDVEASFIKKVNIKEEIRKGICIDYFDSINNIKKHIDFRK